MDLVLDLHPTSRRLKRGTPVKATLPDAALAIGLDADDTLWHNESRFIAAQDIMRNALEPWSERLGLSSSDIDDRLQAKETTNLARYGYGVKGFILSMIETAVELTHGEISGHAIEQILNAGHWMLDHPVELLPGVAFVVPALAASHKVVIITKGDLWDQEAKVARSGLGDIVDCVEVVADKDAETYARILDRHGIDPQSFVMVGNSVKSDIIPVLAIGGFAVYIPHEFGWSHEFAELPSHPRVYQLTSFGDLPHLIIRLCAQLIS